jgi:hypothetical protein
MQELKLSESLDSMDILMTATFALKENSNTPSSQEGNPTLNNFKSELTQISWVISSRDTGGKNNVSFSSEVAAALLELIKKEQRRTQASLVYLRNDGAKDYKTKVLQDFLRQERIRHEVTERHCPQSNGLAERINLTITDKVRCMLIDANLTPKLWPYAAHYVVPIYNNLPHSALDNHKRPSDAYRDSSDFSKLYVFGSICYGLQPSKAST